jgi:hypothetical protein
VPLGIVLALPILILELLTPAGQSCGHVGEATQLQKMIKCCRRFVAAYLQVITSVVAHLNPSSLSSAMMTAA